MQYRPEIDGLRTLAVVPVVMFHAGLPGFPGGFVGVDVFFVISGFLITGIIARDLEAGNFSIVRFYERRARRIVPALMLVLTFSFLAALVILLPFELLSFGQGLIGVVMFVSNIVFWRQSGYFAAQSDLNPLLHTWSLAVEEQFYIFFPLLLWLLWRVGMRAVWGCLGLVALASLALSDFASERAVSANFFLLPTRAWELIFGALLALWLMRRPQPMGWMAELLSLAGLFAIGVSVASFSSATPFPSLYALLPVLGTGMVLLAAQPITLVGRLLALRPMVAIGLVSYSAYLWHQPLFAFARLLTPSGLLSAWAILVLSLATFLLAAVSWRFVEQPFRQQGRFRRNTIFALTGLGGVVFTSFGLLIILTDGLTHRYPQAEREWVETGPLEYSEYVVGAYRLIQDRPLATDRPNLLIIGDSFSQDLFNILTEGNGFAGYSHSAVYIPARCQLYYGVPFDSVREFIRPQDRRLCETRSLTQTHIDMIQKADVVLLAASWQSWAAERLPQTLEAMELAADTQLLVVGPKWFEPDRRSILAMGRALGGEARVQVDTEVLAVNEMLRARVPTESYVDVIGAICDGGCPLFDARGALLSYDGAHLTRAGAIYLAEILFRHTPMALGAN